MNRIVVISILAVWLVAAILAAQTLDIYFIDVEGGQSTLVVAPAGESLLIDTGYASRRRRHSFAGRICDETASRYHEQRRD